MASYIQLTVNIAALICGIPWLSYMAAVGCLVQLFNIFVLGSLHSVTIKYYLFSFLFLILVLNH